MRDERDAEIDPIRREILAGRPLVVACRGRLAGHVREALAVCGRTADGVTVHLDGRGFRRLGLDRSSRRADPDAPGIAGSADPMLRAGILSGLREHGPGLMALPAISPDEATNPRAVTCVVHGGRKDGAGPRYAAWLAVQAWKAAPAGRPGPLLVVDYQPGLDDAFARGFGTSWYDGHGVEFLAIDVSGPRSPAVTRSTSERERWLARLDAWDAAHPVAKGRGFATVEAAGRLVVARRAGDAEGGRRVGAEIFEVRADGTCAGIRLVGEVLRQRPLPPLDALARLAALRGLGLPDSVFPLGPKPVDDPAGALLGAPEARIRALAGGRVDAGIGRALAGSGVAEPVRRLLDDPLRGPARRDFVLTWPFVVDALLDPDVRAGVDGGARTEPLAAAFLGTTPAVARRLVGHPPDPCHASRLGSFGAGSYAREQDSCERLGATLTAIGHDRLPARGDRTGWRGLLAMLATVDAISSRAHCVPLPGEVLSRLALGIPGSDWAARAEALASGPGGQAIEDAGDVVRGLAEWLRPLVGAHVPNETALGILAGHRSLLAVRDASVRWHADARLSAGANGLPDDCAWPVPFGTVDLGAGWSAVALGDLRSLREEGGAGADDLGMAGLDHCVGGYGPACQTGASLILSLRRAGEAGPARVSTVQLVPGPGTWRVGGRPYRLAQHKGRGNRAPGKEAESRLSRLSAMLAGGTVPVDVGALERRRALGADGGDGAAALSLLPAWRRVLPEPWSRMEADEIRAALVAILPRRGGGRG